MPTNVNYTNDGVDVISNEITTIPRYETKTGTVTTNTRNVTGVGTLFLTECKAGDFICNPANFEVRKIKNVVSDTFLTIDHPFSVELASATFKRIKFQDLFQEVFGAIKSGDADGVVNGKTMKNGVPYEWSRKDSLQSSTPNTVDPLIFGAIGTTISITTVK